MNANKKLYGKDLSEYEKMDMDELLDQLTPEEIDILTREVDPDVSRRAAHVWTFWLIWDRGLSGSVRDDFRRA